MTIRSIAFSQSFYPGFYFPFTCSVQEFTFLPVHIRIGCFQVLAGLLDAAAARGGKWDDGFALEFVGLHKRVDNSRTGVPPDGESDIIPYLY